MSRMRALEGTKSQTSIFDIQRRVVAHKTQEAWDQVPHAGLCMDLDVTAVLSFAQALKESGELGEARVTLNSIFLKIFAEGLKECPEMNAHVEYDRRTGVGEVTTFEAIHIAVPLLTAQGRMITPVLQDAGTKTLGELCAAMEDLKRRADNTDVDLLLRETALRDTWERLKKGQLGVLRRVYPNLVGKARLARVSKAARERHRLVSEQDRITPENLMSATVLVSNVGSALPGVDLKILFLEIIPPQTTVIGLGPVVKRPRVVTNDDGEDVVAVRSILPATVFSDHRVMDLEHGMRFVKRVEALCDDPRQLLHGGRDPV